MEKMEQPDQRDDAQPQIQLLSAEEIQTVSGGQGMSRIQMTVPQRKAGELAGRTIYHA
ncbi:hypothetical protein [Achromobacter sp.]|uniref:hypothetical protein n=1 Tax=Achromobacter sp. TaxID=134375 RepID=UPI003C755AD8